MIVGLWLDLVFGVYAPACTRIRCQCHSAHLSNIKCYQSDAASRRVSHHISNGCVTAITSSVYNRRLFPRLNDSASVCDIRITCRDRTCQYKARITHRKQQQQTNSEKSNILQRLISVVMELIPPHHPSINHLQPSFSSHCFEAVEHSAKKRHVRAATDCF